MHIDWSEVAAAATFLKDRGYGFRRAYNVLSSLDLLGRCSRLITTEHTALRRDIPSWIAQWDD